MNSRDGGCCTARYNNAKDMAQVNRILLRYRPIAPKPAARDSIPQSSVEETAAKGGRGRRNKECKNRKNSKVGSKKRKANPAVVTLQLLPESPGPIRSSLDEKDKENNSDNSNGDHVGSHVSGGERNGYLRLLNLNRSCVKVESVAYTWSGDEVGLGQRDDEKVMRLENDPCPGFVSDGSNRVVWVNGAYKEMFGGGDIWLGLRDGMELGGCGGGFTCQVRVVTCGNKNSSLKFPCDVWRMEFGGFAWRLDTKAALSLGW